MPESLFDFRRQAANKKGIFRGIFDVEDAIFFMQFAEELFVDDGLASGG